MNTCEVLEYAIQRYPGEFTPLEAATDLGCEITPWNRDGVIGNARRMLGNLYKYGYLDKRVENNQSYFSYCPEAPR